MSYTALDSTSNCPEATVTEAVSNLIKHGFLPKPETSESKVLVLVPALLQTFQDSLYQDFQPPSHFLVHH